jgi:hypothetical protein
MTTTGGRGRRKRFPGLVDKKIVSPFLSSTSGARLDVLVEVDHPLRDYDPPPQP